MPIFEKSLIFPRSMAEVFDFFIQPVNLLRVTLPELHMELVEAPKVLQLGSTITLKGRRWGISQRIVSRVTEFEVNAFFVDEQVSGPFRKWKHTHRFTPAPMGIEVKDTIEFEPPGGLLGLVVTESFVLNDLEKVFTYRAEKLREILG